MTEDSRQQVDFSSLVVGLATSAVAVLAQVESLIESGSSIDIASGERTESLSPEEVEKRVPDGLAGARQLIDTLAMLEEKTKGNLTGEETELLQGAISELRIRYVSLANRPVTADKHGEGESG
jgi:hypothetical protein